MRTLCSLAFASLVAVVVPAVAHADAPRNVRIDQVARRTVGRCSYATTLRGSYALGEHNAVQNAVVDADTQVSCRGERPIESSREVFFANATEPELLARVDAIATMDYPSAHHGSSCGFHPVVARQDATVTVTDVAFTCEHAASPTR